MVKGQAYEVKPESLLNQERFIDEEAMVSSLPPVPKYANPWERDGRLNSPIMVDEA